MSEFCRVSVIFELDNASFEDYPVWSSRLLGLMRWVCLSVPAETVEFIVVHAGSSAIDKFLAMLPDELGSRVVILDLAGLPASYYQMKNAGAQIAAGQLLVFLDSDLVPVCGDFSDLLAPVIENKCMVACGHTFFPTDTFLERCYAVFWMFPIFKFPETIGKYQLFVSSTVVPKQWFIEFGSFPQVGGLRASCTLFSRALQRAGYSIAHPDVWFRHALWDDRVSFLSGVPLPWGAMPIKSRRMPADWGGVHGQQALRGIFGWISAGCSSDTFAMVARLVWGHWVVWHLFLLGWAFLRWCAAPNWSKRLNRSVLRSNGCPKNTYIDAV